MDGINRPNLKMCVLENAAHCKQKEGMCVDHGSVEDLKKLNKNKALVKKLEKSCGFFFESDHTIEHMTRLLGPRSTKAGKFPTNFLSTGDDMREKMDESLFEFGYDGIKANLDEVVIGFLFFNTRQKNL